MKIEDNFLDQEKFDELQNVIMSNDFSWYYTDDIDFGTSDSDGKTVYLREEDKNKFMFTHLFYSDVAPRSSFCEKLKPIFDIIKPLSIWRIKANLLTRTPNIVENSFHVDIINMSKEKLKQFTTSIFYVNTNNGYTEFEDGTKVESVANRLITFSSDMKHKGTSCTDEKTRVVINFNYFAL